jgi:hypothetical protein
MNPTNKKTYEVHFTGCLPIKFVIGKDENINAIIKDYVKRQNAGVPKSERIKLEKKIRK